MLTINSEYQRGQVWNSGQQKRLIDSVLRGYPLPIIYLHHKRRIIEGMTKEFPYPPCGHLYGYN
ncbi:MAG: DUF262 domain-containing protein [Saprospiraceae bacterium]|uniref:DUF262 domain-containing protein n=1 Tax=Candidatus Opimibacter skivensis TaxID=2982028 RepID=A0A9D7SY56_9BACT|nr:DUF262 domain-containing protein [Candidatus Opimibacter skivensis]